MRILVVEDNKKHREAAKKQLTEQHDVTIVKSFVIASELLLGNEGAAREYQNLASVPFDAALLDLNMPAEKTASCSQVGEGEVPYGFILALRAVQCGVKYVGIITDANHHSGPLTAALDLICPAYWHEDGSQPVFRIDETRLVIAHAPFEEGDPTVAQAKDWGRLLSRLMSS
ncbi:MAG: hypothetical protein NT108_02175 [Candidatus Kaiserbacteria bacterium]|nr:hypothetical protein [Candidatus Kaiserbacteria bacterium]